VSWDGLKQLRRYTRVTLEESWGATGVSRDLASAVPSADAVGPTGEGFVSGSYDRTIRLWDRDAGKARDIYHTKRMQRSVPPTFL